MASEMISPAYRRLVERINRFPQGAPPSDNLYRILRILVNEREAELMAQLPMKPFTAAKAARIWKVSEAEARGVLNGLADRAVIVDSEHDGTVTYVVPPPMPGFFEFSMMRMRDDVDQHALADLYQQYCTNDDAFMADLIGQGETQIGRVFVNEPILKPEVHVLDYERASEVINTSPMMGISTCYCRFKARESEHADACDAPLDICMTFNGSADSLIRHGFARPVDKAEGMDLLQQAYEHNLVQFGENGREGVNFICNCCGCCCEAMIAARKFALGTPIHTSNFLPEVTRDTCTGCGICVNLCPVEAISLVSANDPLNGKRKVAKVNPDVCLGCGVCARACPSHAIELQSREERVVTPLNGVHRVAMMAIERGNFQDLIFDNRALWSHRTLAAVLGTVLKLPPVKRAMATEQMKSRFLESLVRRYFS